MVVADKNTRVYSERLIPSPLAWLIAPGVGAVFLVMFLPIGTGVAVGAGLGFTAVTALWLWRLATPILLSPTHLTVGRAHIEIDALGDALVCDAADVRHYMGPGSDARSYVLTRPWIRGGIYVPQTDPRDPTPYWLFSTRYPAELSEALGRAQQAL